MEKEEKKTAVGGLDFTGYQWKERKKKIPENGLCFFRSGITFVNMYLQDSKKYDNVMRYTNDVDTICRRTICR